MQTLSFPFFLRRTALFSAAHLPSDSNTILHYTSHLAILCCPPLQVMLRQLLSSAIGCSPLSTVLSRAAQSAPIWLHHPPSDVVLPPLVCCLRRLPSGKVLLSSLFVATGRSIVRCPPPCCSIRPYLAASSACPLPCCSVHTAPVRRFTTLLSPCYPYLAAPSAVRLSSVVLLSARCPCPPVHCATQSMLPLSRCIVRHPPVLHRAAQSMLPLYADSQCRHVFRPQCMLPLSVLPLLVPIC